MDIEELAHAIEARLAVPNGLASQNIEKVYGAATISDLIANASPDTLLVTPLNNIQLARVVDLMDVPGLCLVDGHEPDVDLMSHMRTARTALLVAHTSLVETCARAAVLLASQRKSRP
jgi:hypothetical protein